MSILKSASITGKANHVGFSARLKLKLHRKLSFHFLTAQQRFVMTAARARIAEEVKIDVLSKTMDADNAALVKNVSRSFISDTITVPTKEMYAYAVQASLGDDIYAIEPSTRALEKHIAQLTGKEAALFVPSGTMSNQLAIRTHLKQPPYSVLVDHRSHMDKYEAGGSAFHSGAAHITVIPSNRHHLTLSDIESSIVTGNDVHLAPTELIAIENTLNGTIIPQEEIVAISEFAHSKGIKMHLDGARIWHVAIETETPIKVLCNPFDSVSLCFSKGLGAPVGSCLAGTSEFITKARWFRKIFGGSMRQTGILSACAAYALSHNFSLLPAVHALARYLEQGLVEIGVDIMSPAETCMLFYDPSPISVTYDEIANKASQLSEPLTLAGSRIVVHVQTTKQAVDDLLSVIQELSEEKKKKAGFVRADIKPQLNSGIYNDIHIRRTRGTARL